MKKLALILSVIMVLSCCLVMAACGNEETSSTPATSTETSSEDAKSEAESSVADESVEESVEESAEASEDESVEASEDESKDEPKDEPTVGEASNFWVTHYANDGMEGAGVVYTDHSPNLGWRIHVAFKPIDGVEGGYEITEIANNLDTGDTASLALPEGGFIYCINRGNDYPSIGMDGPNYTSANCDDMISLMLTWAVGDQFVIEGLDFENVPTSTPDLNWYDPTYVCTATIAPIE